MGSRDKGLGFWGLGLTDQIFIGLGDLLTSTRPRTQTLDPEPQKPKTPRSDSAIGTSALRGSWGIGLGEGKSL